MANVIISDTHLKNIANAIRTKKGSITKMRPADMAGEISSIQINVGGGGLDTSDATATSNDIVANKTAYVKGVKITGTIPDRASWSSAITTLNPVTIPSGVHNGAGKVEISSTEKSKIIPSNIKSGVSILGVTGNMQVGSTGTDTSDATAVAGDILQGKTAYANGKKITGTISSRSGWSGSITTKAQVVKIPEGYHNGTSTSVSIDAAEQNKIIPQNIKSGINILGVYGTYQGSGGVNTSDATAVAENILTGKTAYVNGGKVTGTMPDNSNNGAIEIVSRDSMVKIPKGYYDGTKVYAYIATDSYNKLIPANIKSGVTILGVTGSYEGGAGGGSIVKTGRTSSQTINTGLSNISHFIMYTDKIYSVGVTSLAYDAGKNQCSLTFCGEYSAYSKYCNTVIKQPFMVSGGDIVWTETMQEYGYMTGATYNWIAIGS